jgi:thiamine-phosphate pyrophosphorylase
MQTAGRLLPAILADALRGGVQAVQLREKDLAAGQLFKLAFELRQLTRDYGASLLINDRIDVALASDADGVHLGKASLPVAEARRILGDDRLIGYSAHSVEDALQAQRAGADFVTLGPVYLTPSKAQYGEPLGVNVLSEAARLVSIPVFALGGIKLSTVNEVLSAGSHGVALISAVMAAPNVMLETESLLRTIEHHAIAC